MKKKPHLCLLFSNSKMEAHAAAINIAEQYFQIEFRDTAPESSPSMEVPENTDLIVSIFNPKRITGRSLILPNFNIHAAPRWYRGAGAIGRALVDKKNQHAVTAHKMAYEYDAGAIYIERVFDITSLSAFDIADRCISNSLATLTSLCQHFEEFGQLPEPDSNLAWIGEIMTTSEFNSWISNENFSEKENVLAIYKPFFKN